MDQNAIELPFMDVGICTVDGTEGHIDLAAAHAFVCDPGHGGLATFVGMVRDVNHGRDVVAVSYDIFPALVLKTFRDIAAQAYATYGPSRIYIRHAHGRLAVGDVAVVVSVGTRHRDEAFRACRDVIEAVKHTAPIWKQEHYVDGDSAWTEGCALCHEPDASGSGTSGSGTSGSDACGSADPAS